MQISQQAFRFCTQIPWCLNLCETKEGDGDRQTEVESGWREVIFILIGSRLFSAVALKWLSTPGVYTCYTSTRTVFPFSQHAERYPVEMPKRLCQPCWSPGHWAAVFALSLSLLNSIIILLVLVCVKCLQSQADNPKKGMSEKQKTQVNYPCGDACHFFLPCFFNTSHLFYLTSC